MGQSPVLRWTLTGTQIALSPQPSSSSLNSKASFRIPGPHPHWGEPALNLVADLLDSGAGSVSEAG